MCWNITCDGASQQDWNTRVERVWDGMRGLPCSTSCSPGGADSGVLAGVGCLHAGFLGAVGGFVLTLAGFNVGTAPLATSPGGIVEMALTARVLHLGALIVTAFHVSRMVAILVIGLLYACT